jgi:hypothetical protein
MVVRIVAEVIFGAIGVVLVIAVVVLAVRSNGIHIVPFGLAQHSFLIH